MLCCVAHKYFKFGCKKTTTIIATNIFSSMILVRNIVAAATSILLILISTPASVKGTCQCAEVCPWYEVNRCWAPAKDCSSAEEKAERCDSYCVCNVFGCNCDPCENYPGACDGVYSARLLDAEEDKDVCADFRYFSSLPAEGKRDFLADNYCSEDDEVAVEDIYELLLNEVLKRFDGTVLTCDVFNKAYVDVSQLTLCADKQQHLEVVPANTKKGKKQKKTP